MQHWLNSVVSFEVAFGCEPRTGLEETSFSPGLASVDASVADNDSGHDALLVLQPESLFINVRSLTTHTGTY